MLKTSQLVVTFLLNASWQCALAAVLAAWCSRLLRHRSAVTRHILWVAALVASFAVPASTSLYLAMSERPTSKVPIAEFADNQSGEEEPETSEPVQVKEQMTPPRLERHSNAPLRVGQRVASALFFAYLVFLSFRIARLLNAWRGARLIRRSARPVEDPDFLNPIVTRCRRVLGVRGGRVMHSESALVPMTFGNLEPIVVLPNALINARDSSLLTAAIGHEFVHILRRDYLFNLIYELLLLPISFHPAAAMIGRRINQTRELGCDELVAEKLLDAGVYARSLVLLAGAAVTPKLESARVILGLADADILEERVMTILGRSKINARRGGRLLLLAPLMFLVPSLAAAPFALRVAIDQPNEGFISTSAPVVPTENKAENHNRQTKPVRKKVLMPPFGSNAQSATLVSWLKKPGDEVSAGEIIAQVDNGREVIGVEAKTSGVVERLLLQPGERASTGKTIAIIRDQTGSDREAAVAREQMERKQVELQRELSAQKEGLDKKARAEVKAKLEAELLEAQEHQELLASSEASRLAQESLEKELEQRAREERALREDRLTRERLSDDPDIIARRKAEREAEARQQIELAKQATISMQRAIDTVTTQFPGTVLESRLVRERNQPCYRFVILSDNGSEANKTFVIMSAVDGSVLKVEKE
jgi:beta-lactamase regulating signal transducer with metallopeptidase domain/uncharacterized membrane protein YkoI